MLLPILVFCYLDRDELSGRDRGSTRRSFRVWALKGQMPKGQNSPVSFSFPSQAGSPVLQVCPEPVEQHSRWPLEVQSTCCRYQRLARGSWGHWRGQGCLVLALGKCLGTGLCFVAPSAWTFTDRKEKIIKTPALDRIQDYCHNTKLFDDSLHTFL